MYNLLQELNDSYGYMKQIKGCIVYGRIMHAIESVGYLSKQELTGGFNVVVDVIGISVNDVIQPSRGQLIAVLDDPEMLGKYVKIRNRAGGDTSVRAGEGGRAMKHSINVRNFRKSDGKWVIAPNHFEELTPSELGLIDIRVSVAMLESAKGQVTGDVEDDDLYYTGLPSSDIIVKEINGVGKTFIGEEIVGVAGTGGTANEDVGNDFEDDKEFAAPAAIDESKTAAPLVHRLESAPQYEHLASFQEEIARCEEARGEYRSALVARSDDNEFWQWQRDVIIMGFVKAFVMMGDSRLGTTQQKRRIVAESVIDKLDMDAEASKTFKQEIRYTPNVMFDGTSGMKPVENRWTLFFAILDVCLGTDYYSERAGETYGKLLLSSPYDHATMYGKSPETADKAFFLISLLRNQGYGTGGYETPEAVAEAGWIDLESETQRRDILLATSKLVDESEGSTLIGKRDVFANGYEISSAVAKSIKEYGMPYLSYEYARARHLAEGIAMVRETDVHTQLIDVRLGAAGRPNDKAEGEFGQTTYKTMNWGVSSKGYQSYLEITAGVSLADVIDTHGLAIEVGEELISSVYLEMEQFIYEKTHEMGNLFSGVTDEHIAQAIKEYEAEKGFQLEELQKDGIKVVKYRAGILSGQAGSGKTTVSEVMVRALKLSLPDYQIKFAAPTGKAARRMKEVLGDLGDVRTIHSLFKVGIGSVNLFEDSADNDNPIDSSEEKIAYIVDESAMTTVPLVYKMLKKMAETSIVFFLGDVKQLPPIGKGMPFRDMMNYLPCVELGVSKRAKEGSGINRNCDLINQFSEQGNYIALEEADDFRFAYCDDSKIPDTVVRGVRGYVEKHGFTAEDVVVATPYATPKKEYGSKKLNPKLQELFLPGVPTLFTHKHNASGEEGRAFREGARAIHVSTNRYGKRKYRLEADGKTFVQEPSVGVVNGEVGFIKGIVRARDVEIMLDDDYNDQMENAGIETEDDTPAQKDFDKTYYVIFETDDVDLGRKVLVLYQGIDKGKDEHNGVFLQSRELWQLDLAYALTVHKLQGSQAKLVVIPLGSRDNTEFVNRNMLYTAVSRAQERVAVVGSVGSKNSTLENARNVAVQGRVRSVLSIMSGTKEML